MKRNSCGSIGTCALVSQQNQFDGGCRPVMTSPKLCDRMVRSQSVRRPSTPDSPDLDQDSYASAQIMERVKPDRVACTKPEEDRRRRTIIVEKKNGNYGFTLQSYGIHYKKEHEIEMITYVDYVEYDGPAYRAGMREGDVILSINGHDMEKVDHKAMVNFIKSCEPRMRMVVLFEDCVRKVELHMRYLQLQKMLESKTAELDRLCSREREILQGRWKTHSLPARKKGGSIPPPTSTPAPSASIEDVTNRQLLLSYHYLDPRYQYVLPAGSRNNEYVVTWSQGEVRHFVVKADAQPRHRGHNQTSNETRTQKPGKTAKQHRQLCNPCIQAGNQQDNNSLEAYDLASPCCQPKCVPSARRRSRHKHRQESLASSHHASNHSTPKPRCEKYLRFGSGGSSDMSPRDSSIASYSTSLSTDTLWDGNERQQNSRPHTTKVFKTSQQATSYQYNVVKPKSWDNLTSKGYGGYGFGYGYLGAAEGGKTPPPPPSKTTTMPHFSKVVYKGGRPSSMQVCRQVSATDSTTELLLDTSQSCDCLDQHGTHPSPGLYKGGARRMDHAASEVTRL